MRRLLIALMAPLLLLLPISTANAQAVRAAAAFRVLLFTKTAGYRHDSIPAGITMFQQLAAANNFEVVPDRGLEPSSPTANLATFDVDHHAPDLRHGLGQRRPAPGRAGLRAPAARASSAIHNATDMNIEAEFPWWDQTVNWAART